MYGLPTPEMMELSESLMRGAAIRNAVLASDYLKRITQHINSFNMQLDDEHEVGMTAVAFGAVTTLLIEELSCYDPGIICFKGKSEDGKPAHILQNVTQISVMLVSIPRVDPSQPKRTIGFRTANDDEANIEEED